MASHNNRLVSLIYLLFISIPLVLGIGAKGVTFLYPTPGLTLHYLDTVNVTLISEYPSPRLYTLCKRRSNGKEFTPRIENVHSFNGSQLVDLKFPSVSSCQFNLRPNSSDKFGDVSPSFTVLPEKRPKKTTVGLNQPTNTKDPSATATSKPVPDSQSGLSTGAKAGIGVGVAVGVIGVCCLIGAFVYVRRRRAKSDPAADSSSKHKEGADGLMLESEEPNKAPKTAPVENAGVQELDAAERYELPARPVVHELRGD